MRERRRRPPRDPGVALCGFALPAVRPRPAGHQALDAVGSHPRRTCRTGREEERGARALNAHLVPSNCSRLGTSSVIMFSSSGTSAGAAHGAASCQGREEQAVRRVAIGPRTADAPRGLGHRRVRRKQPGRRWQLTSPPHGSALSGAARRGRRSEHQSKIHEGAARSTSFSIIHFRESDRPSHHPCLTLPFGRRGTAPWGGAKT